MIVNNLSIFIYNYTTKVRYYINCIYYACVYYSQIFRICLLFHRRLRIGLLFFLYLVSIHSLSFAKNPEKNEGESKERRQIKAMELSFHSAEVSQDVSETLSSMASELEEESAYNRDIRNMLDEAKDNFFETTEPLTEETISFLLGNIDETVSDLEKAEVRARKCLVKLENLIAHKKLLLTQSKIRLSNCCCRLQEVIVEGADITQLESSVQRKKQRIAHQEATLKILEEKYNKAKESQSSQEESNNALMKDVAALEDFFFTQAAGEENSDENMVSPGGNHHQENYDDMPPLEGEEDPEDITDQGQQTSGSHSNGAQGHLVNQASSTETQAQQEGASSQQGCSSRAYGYSASSPGSSQGGGSGMSTLIPGYNIHSQMSSLQGLQCVLLSTVEQVAENLKILTLKAVNTSKENKFNVASFNHGVSKKNTSFQKHFSANVPANKQGIDNRIVSSLDKFHVFAVMDGYSMNLEKKVRSGQLGIITDIFSDLSIGLVYEHNSSSSKEYTGVMFDSAIGSAKQQ